MNNLVLFKLIKQLFLWEIEVNQKLLHLSKFPTTKTKFLTQAQKDSGFTILELITTVLIIGILSAIAAPAWNGFINNQRTRTVNDAVLRALRSAQSDAKLKKKEIKVTFKYDEDPPVDPPVVSINNIDQTLNANGEIKAKMVKLATGKCANDDCSNGFTTDTKTNITFDYRGVMENDDSLPFAITTAIAEGTGAKRCVIVQTILGNMRTAEGDQCPQPDNDDW
ncbi:MAG: type II secretion system GspH family protein [Trichodesmium sp. MAG_R04]|nr:type II secretion system GspH family protein [Trichodesmium sp. MAG_R04]